MLRDIATQVRLRTRCAASQYLESPGQHRIDDEVPVSGERYQQELASPLETFECAAGNVLGEIPGQGTHGAGLQDGGVVDLQTDDPVLQKILDDLQVRRLGHAPLPGRAKGAL